MLCEKCGVEEAVYRIRKTPKEEGKPLENLSLCEKCTAKYLERDTISLVRISKPEKEA